MEATKILFAGKIVNQHTHIALSQTNLSLKDIRIDKKTIPVLLERPKRLVWNNICIGSTKHSDVHSVLEVVLRLF